MVMFRVMVKYDMLTMILKKLCTVTVGVYHKQHEAKCPFVILALANRIERLRNFFYGEVCCAKAKAQVKALGLPAEPCFTYQHNEIIVVFLAILGFEKRLIMP